jgi:hypothetical protein
MTSNFTRRDSLDAGVTGHGSAPVRDETGTSPMPRRTDLARLAAEFARFNAGTRAAALADRNECECGRRFGDHIALIRHRNAAHKTTTPT